MSARRRAPPTAEAFKGELADLAATAKAADAAVIAATLTTDTVKSQHVAPGSISSALDALTPTERSVAALGVSPDALKPIAFMNEKHFEALKKANRLDENLARRIEAFRVVSAS